MHAARFPTLALLVALLAALLPAAAAAERPSRAPHRPRVVERVDLPRYCGTWHEIAHIPNRFQKDCGCCATATYALRADGKLSVTNRCRKADGTLDEFTAEAEVVDTRTNARLKLTPLQPSAWRPSRPTTGSSAWNRTTAGPWSAAPTASTS